MWIFLIIITKNCQLEKWKEKTFTNIRFGHINLEEIDLIHASSINFLWSRLLILSSCRRDTPLKGSPYKQLCNHSWFWSDDTSLATRWVSLVCRSGRKQSQTSEKDRFANKSWKVKSNSLKAVKPKVMAETFVAASPERLSGFVELFFVRTNTWERTQRWFSLFVRPTALNLVIRMLQINWGRSLEKKTE